MCTCASAWLGIGQFPDRCYLQVNGVYSDPDYLGGRCFADFREAHPGTRGSAQSDT
jgi:hypothetical protein